MIRILGCLTQQHDLRLVACAALICCLACFTTVNMLHRARSHTGRAWTGWWLAASLVFGCGVWATHFVAMLGFVSDMTLGYSLPLTALSFPLVCGGAAAAFWLALRKGDQLRYALAAGVALGCGVAAMHYCGVYAMWVTGTVSYLPEYVAGSIVAAIGLSFLALRTLASTTDLHRTAWRTFVLTASIVALHFTGMTALRIELGSVAAPSELLLGSAALITAVVAISIAILALSLVVSVLDQHLSQRLSIEANKLQHLAHHDPLTGLPNRTQCQEQLALMTAKEPGADSTVAVLCLDLDRFKSVNDLLGHRAGDQLLIQVGARLRSLLRPADMVARIGGDEFVIAVPAPVDPTLAASLAGRIVDALSEPFRVEEQQVTIGVSVGIAMAPADGVTGAQLLQNADAALYQAKNDGRGSYRFFEAAIGERVRVRQVLEHDLRTGIHSGQLELHYQPLMDIETQGISGFEALVRWRHPKRGLVPPNDFIPLAEESGLIIPLGRWVLEHACREAVTWDLPLRIAVNLSPAQFRQADLADQIIGILAATGLAPDRLELELTESVLIRHADEALAALNRLKALGVSISLDDFGTGYSSLSYLRRFPFNKIKLDQSFIRALGDDEEARVITKAIVGLGRSLRLCVTAEGVETADQMAFLASENCDQAQGYLIGKPIPGQQLAAFLTTTVYGGAAPPAPTPTPTPAPTPALTREPSGIVPLQLPASPACAA